MLLYSIMRFKRIMILYILWHSFKACGGSSVNLLHIVLWNILSIQFVFVEFCSKMKPMYLNYLLLHYFLLINLSKINYDHLLYLLRIYTLELLKKIMSFSYCVYHV